MDLSLRDAATLLKVSETTVSDWVERGGLTAFIINGRYRFNRVDLLEWASHRKLPTAALFRSEAGLPGLAALLAGNVHHDVPGADMAAAMAAVAERLPLSDPRDKALAAQAFWARETLGSTGIGEGIAIPHARNPLVFPVEHPLVTLCFLAQPVDFKAADGLPVRTVWALVTSTVRQHLAMLALIASALHDPDFHALVLRRAPERELLARLGTLG